MQKYGTLCIVFCAQGFSPLTSLPGYRPISARIKPSHSFLQPCRAPLCGWAIVYSTGSPRCGHFGNFP